MSFQRPAPTSLAVGAYGKCLLTMDGGKSWQPAAPVPDEVHLNQIAPTASDRSIWAGESGTLLVFGRRAHAVAETAVPYEGSLFGVLPLGGKRCSPMALRGHVFWSEVPALPGLRGKFPCPCLIMAGVKLKSGVIVLAGLGGNFFVSRDGGRTFEAWKTGRLHRWRGQFAGND